MAYIDSVNYLYRYSKSQQVNVASCLCRDLTVHNLTNYLHKKYKDGGVYVARVLNLPVLPLQYMVYLTALVPLALILTHGHVEACRKRGKSKKINKKISEDFIKKMKKTAGRIGIRYMYKKAQVIWLENESVTPWRRSGRRRRRRRRRKRMKRTRKTIYSSTTWYEYN